MLYKILVEKSIPEIERAEPSGSIQDRAILALFIHPDKSGNWDHPHLVVKRLKEGIHTNLKLFLAQFMSLCQDHVGWRGTYFSCFKRIYSRCTRNPAKL